MNARVCVFVFVALLLSCLPSTAAAQVSTCEACGWTEGWNGLEGDCYSVVTGIAGFEGCARNMYNGCDFYGGPCTNGQEGPPTPDALCLFRGECRGPFQKYACVRTLEDEVLRWAPAPGQRFSVIRTSAGQLVQFAHLL